MYTPGPKLKSPKKTGRARKRKSNANQGPTSSKMAQAQEAILIEIAAAKEDQLCPTPGSTQEPAAGTS